ncbi:MAG: hypothetical protein U0M50_08100 [Paramuribaculum sp.]
MKQRLSYRNENDKCYGITGMAMAVVIFDGEEMLAGVDMDAEPGAAMQFTGDFYFNGNPGFSAKNAWNQILKNFNLAMALAIGNVMCRRMILEKRAVESDMADYLREMMVEEGRDNCALEEDETTRLFNKNYSYLSRVFGHHGVQDVARDFARTLRARRTMTRLDVLEQLRALSML